MKHYNNRLIDSSRRIFKTKVADMISSEVNPTIQPTVEITEIYNYFGGGASTATGNINIAMPSDRDVLIDYITVSFVKNAACDIATGIISVTGTFSGTSRNLANFAVLTLTAERGEAFITFQRPLKPDRGTNITMTGTFGAGAMSRVISIAGYTEE